MSLTPTLFKRHHGDHCIYDCPDPIAQWVIKGEGVATRKWDGVPVLISGRAVYKRIFLPVRARRPRGFVPISERNGWIPVSRMDRAYHEALDRLLSTSTFDDIQGTWELCGPDILGNPERLADHTMFRHGEALLPRAPRTYGALDDYLQSVDIEGIVWHHPDGRRAKLKGKDFPGGGRRGALWQQ